MPAELAGIAGFAAALVLIALRVPVAVAMGLVGVVGAIPLAGWPAVRFMLGTLPFGAVHPYGLSVVPLFIFMGVFAAHAGLSRNLYDGIYAFVGHVRGGLALATIGACAGFGAICGSSLATAATMSRVALPEMRRKGYADSLAAASVAAGGTLGVLIPPSIILVIYALLTRESIGALFAAALFPGLLGTALYMLAVRVRTRMNPGLGPAGERRDTAGRLRALGRTWDVVLLFVVVIGGIYAGLFSPTEAAAVGAAGAFVFAALRGRLTREVLLGGIREAAVTSGMIFFILIGAALFNFFIESSNLPQFLVSTVAALDWPAWGVMVVLLLFYLLLGCFMDSLSMMLLTVPFVFPVVTHLGYDPVWFGVVLVTVIELGLITPPIGMNLFVIQAADERLSLPRIMTGIIPFILADVLRLALLLAFPVIALGLPRALGLG
ncbi:C4-dicarboxylate TRAP transporter large permease protein DctM [wastewater metagenome]|uniref:C4-dicarboxylate TRAP transporter large permease protein DctM n=2 Tax=unclassified sequences TaxID=12908 RepID=A0A5B8R744_9ZZZZ|nr:TRAP transporter large permease [Arhodomonas sp. KWT]QEA03768.1 C4-dicarboxylate TRAP transporter large permease protein DctM [uncultured organism]